MGFRGLRIASVATTAMLALMAAVAIKRIPAGMLLPVHWNAAGLPDRFAAPVYALWLPVVLTGGLSLLLATLPRLEPMQRRMDASAPLLVAAWAGLLAMMTLAQLAIAGPWIGVTSDPSLMLVATGLLLLAIGNALPKSRPGFFVGIRTPWTLTDTDNWVATHRLAGLLFAIAGLIVMFAGLSPIDAEARRGLVVAAILQAVVTPPFYSFLHWRKRNGRAA